MIKSLVTAALLSVASIIPANAAVVFFDSNPFMPFGAPTNVEINVVPDILLVLDAVSVGSGSTTQFSFNNNTGVAISLRNVTITGNSQIGSELSLISFDAGGPSDTWDFVNIDGTGEGLSGFFLNDFDMAAGDSIVLTFTEAGISTAAGITISASVQQIPVPAGLPLLAGGLGLLALARRKRAA